MRKGGRRYSSPQSPGHRSRFGREGLVEHRAWSRVVEVEVEGAAGCRPGARVLAEPRPDDDGRDRRMIQHPAGRHIGDRHPMPLRRLCAAAARMPWNTAQPPTASMKRLYLLLLQSGERLGRPAPARRASARTGDRPPACHRPAAAPHGRGRRRLSAPAARRSSSENDTWLVRSGIALPDEDVADGRCRQFVDAEMGDEAPPRFRAASSRAASR